jgi:hypothetical protein
MRNAGQRSWSVDYDGAPITQGAHSVGRTQPSKQLAVYETTYAGASQYGVTIWQAGVPLHNALPPSAHREKWAQQPTALQPQLPGSTNTEWQSVRASHVGSSATFAQGVG